MITARWKRIEEKISELWNAQKNCFVGGVLIGVLTYFMMMASNLVNDLDGIWHLSNFIAGDWEISLGRGLQRYADRARFGIVSDSFNTILTLVWVAGSANIIITIFCIKNTLCKGMFMLILIANPIVCHSLSYSYMSVNFGLAYFMSTVAFGCIASAFVKKKLPAGILLSGAFLGISMAFYQAYICVTCVLMLMFLLQQIINQEKVKDIFLYIWGCCGAIVSGGMIYVIITKALLYRAGIQLASYGGASNVSLGVIFKNLPDSFVTCYQQFWNYIYTQKVFSKLEFVDVMLAGMMIFYCVVVIIQLVKLWKDSIIHAFLFVLALLLLPVAGCFVLMIAVGNTMTVIMSMGLLLCMIMPGIIVPKEGKTGFWLKRGYLLFLIFFGWFQLSAVVNDQLALKEGKTATITLTENIITMLYSEGYLEECETVALVGRPANNDSFVWSTAYQRANGYAKFGCWSTEARNHRVSWNGVISNFLGVNLSLCDESKYKKIKELEQVANMPEFPAKGSICVIDDIVVVKVSEVY